MAKVTIKQIAELAGVSVPAVSYVINGKKGVSDETRRRVQQIMDELHYTPNVNSRRLSLQRSFNIVVSLDVSSNALENLFYVEVLNAIVTRAAALGYNVVLSHNSDGALTDHLQQLLSQHNADGVLFLQDIPSSLKQQLDHAEIPFVVTDSHKLQAPYHCIKADSELASYLATRHLIENGHRKIAFIGMNRLPDFYARSFGGYKKALSEAHIAMLPDWVQADAVDEPTAQTCMAQILASPELPTAIFCAGDIFAIGAMNYLQNHGYQIPRDFSLCSIDNIILAQYYHPALTTVHIDKQRMGVRAVEILDDLICKRDTVQEESIPFDQMMVRSTVRNLSASR